MTSGMNQSNSSVSQRDAVMASQIAYSDDLNEAFQRLQKTHTTPITVRDLCEEVSRYKMCSGDLLDCVKHNANKGTDLDAAEVYLSSVLPSWANASDIDEVMDWSFAYVYDNNSVTIEGHTGLYACALDVGNNNLLVSFRGSESAYALDNAINDWGSTNLGLLNSAGDTPQQRDLEILLHDLEKEGLFEKYKSISTGGHSLGGFEAEDFARVMVEHGFEEKLCSVYSLDGPGASNEYFEKYGEIYERMKDKITEISWSSVGELLNHYPGVNRLYANVSRNAMSQELFGYLYNIAGSHAVEHLDKWDGENVSLGEAWNQCISIGLMTKFIDNLPPEIGNKYRDQIVEEFYGIIRYVNTADKNRENMIPGFKQLCGFFEGTIALGQTNHLLGTLSKANELGMFYYLLQTKDETLFKWLSDPKNLALLSNDYLEVLRIFLAEELEKEKKKNPDLFARFVNSLNSLWLDISWREIKRTEGSEYSRFFPELKVNTEVLRRYSDQLQKVKRRLDSLQAQLRQSSFFLNSQELANLTRNNPLIGSGTVIDQACRFLNETADEFDSVEEYLNTL